MQDSYIPEIFKQFNGLVAAQSTRHGGVSPHPYHSLNLGLSTGDDKTNVLKNREIFFGSLGINAAQVALSKQIHSDNILHTALPGNYADFDAIITSVPNVFVAVSIADCVPVLVYDTKNQAVAAIHAGWKGTVSEIAGKTLKKMQDELGTIPENCFTYVGTCIDECSFETDGDVADRFLDEFKRFDESRNKYFIDLKKANTQQLKNFGIPENQIEVSAFSTVRNNKDYFSHRFEKGTTGRMMAIIGNKN